MTVATRTTHVKVSLFFYLIPMIILYFMGWRYNPIRDTLWIVVGFLLTLYGSEFPDFDQLFKRIFDHRDWFTHSAILPALLSLFTVFVSNATVNGSDNGVYLPILAFFSLGVSSHLIMDWLPTWDNESKDGKLQLTDLSYALKFGVQGLTGEELVQKLVGTYLIHLPWKTKDGRRTLTKNQTRFYLMFNALLLIFLAAFLFLVFAEQYGEVPQAIVEILG